MLEDIGKLLEKNSFRRDLVTFEGDNAYMNRAMKNKLNENGFIYVGKGGGNRKIELNGIVTSEAKHAKRYMGKYKVMKERYRKKALVEDYTRMLSSDGKLIYFQGRFPKKYRKSRQKKRFLVTNKRDATGQWAFQHFSYRWTIESFFRILKQTCGWRKYHPHTSGKRYKTHTTVVLLLYMFLSHVRGTTKGYRKLTIGEVRKRILNECLDSYIKTEFMERLESVIDLEEFFSTK
jgi:hypothetical protein